MTDTAPQPAPGPSPSAGQPPAPVATPTPTPPAPAATAPKLIAVRYEVGLLGHRAGDVDELEETEQVTALIEAGLLVRLVKAVD